MVETHMPKPNTPKPHSPEDQSFELTRFFPYRLAVLTERVSKAVAQVYSDRFELTRAEWRVLAALGVNKKMAAKDIGPYSTLDKMQVSRAVTKLSECGYLKGSTDETDQRSKILTLTDTGRTLYQKIIPLILAREEYILDSLTSEERMLFSNILEKIQHRTDDLVQRG